MVVLHTYASYYQWYEESGAKWEHEDEVRDCDYAEEDHKSPTGSFGRRVEEEDGVDVAIRESLDNWVHGDEVVSPA